LAASGAEAMLQISLDGSGKLLGLCSLGTIAKTMAITVIANTT
jgi:hypothetical protein